MPIYHLSRALMWSTVQRISTFKRVYFINSTNSRVKYRTVRLIETVRLFILESIWRLYGTFNRVIRLGLQTVRLIESLEYIQNQNCMTVLTNEYKSC